MNPESQRGRGSILRRMTMMAWLVAVLSVIVFAAFMVLHLKRTAEKELEEKSRAIAKSVESAIGNPQGRMSTVLLQCFQFLAQDDTLRYIVIQPHVGNALVSYRSAPTPGAASGSSESRTGLQFDWRELAGGPWRRSGGSLAGRLESDIVHNEVWHHTSGGRVGNSIEWGHIHLGLSMDQYNNSVRAIYQNVGFAAAVVLLIGGVTAYVGARNIIKPIRALQSFAQKVTGGALNARAVVSVGGEIGDLAESINRMVSSLEQSTVKLRDSMKQQASLREKEILLREIHHRVKNNMQILTSLLRLQTRQADSQELREVLQESEARIRSMGLLHEKLYQSESVSFIDMHGYLRTLTGELMRMNTPQGARRDIRLNVQNVNMGLDTALPCGLIITELVTNALKYAFPGRADGMIYVGLGTETPGTYQLLVQDDGVGMDNGFDLSKATSLGMRLVKMLTDQLNGSFTFDGSRGTRICITFHESEYKHRL